MLNIPCCYPQIDATDRSREESLKTTDGQNAATCCKPVENFLFILCEKLALCIFPIMEYWRRTSTQLSTIGLVATFTCSVEF